MNSSIYQAKLTWIKIPKYHYYSDVFEIIRKIAKNENSAYKMELDLTKPVVALRVGDIEWLNEHSTEVKNIKEPYLEAIHDSSLASLDWLERRGYKCPKIYRYSYDVGRLGYDSVIKWSNERKLLNVQLHVGALSNLELFKQLWVSQPIKYLDDLCDLICGIIHLGETTALHWVNSQLAQTGLGHLSHKKRRFEFSDSVGFECLNIFPIPIACPNSVVKSILKRSLKILEWMHEHEIKIDRDHLHEAANYGGLEILQWAYENEYTLPSDLLEHTLGSYYDSQFEVSEWLHFIGLKMTIGSIRRLIGSDEESIKPLIWLHQHGYKFEVIHLNEAAANQNYVVLNWLDSLGIRGHDQGMFRINGSDTYLLWLFEHKYPVPKDQLERLKKIQNSKQKG